jgi:hypothetical protein
VARVKELYARLEDCRQPRRKSNKENSFEESFTLSKRNEFLKDQNEKLAKQVKQALFKEQMAQE